MRATGLAVGALDRCLTGSGGLETLGLTGAGVATGGGGGVASTTGAASGSAAVSGTEVGIERRRRLPAPAGLALGRAHLPEPDGHSHLLGRRR
ncbi:MAG: hypothetical protein MZV65_11300 [Chromatiales bacterium]|nr:hypothetical protein [Chromatiales bacterium]